MVLLGSLLKSYCREQWIIIFSENFDIKTVVRTCYIAVYIVVMFMYRDSFLGSFAKMLQKRIATGTSPAANRDDQEESEFDIKKV